METTELKIGDKVFHASNSSIIWVIEKIESNEAYCSTILKNSFEQKKETFALTSIVKYKKPEVRSKVIKRGNVW